MRRNRPCSALILFTLCAATASAADLGFYGWGPRVGVADDPDQVLVGIHQDLGEIVENLRLQPSLDLGLGDDHTVLTALVPVHYRFRDVDAAVTPYVGAGIAVTWTDRDQPRRSRGDDDDLDIAPAIIAGVEWRVRAKADALVEVQLGGGDAHDVRLHFGWIFRAR